MRAQHPAELSPGAIADARHRIEPFIVKTPTLRFDGPSASRASEIWLKAESLQVTGSFKVRGAASHLTALGGSGGVITASSGNHGQALAYVAHRQGRRCTVIVPEDVAQVKADGIVRWGAQVVRYGRTSEDRLSYALRRAEMEALTFVPPYDHPLVMAGQGTVGAEVTEQVPEVATVLVPVSGGGLIAGIATAVKSVRPSVEVIGVEPDALPRFAASRAAGKPVRLTYQETVADGLRVLEPGALTWPVVARHVDRFVAVGDDSILSAVRTLVREARLVVEPSGAVAFAAAVSMEFKAPIVAVLSGGNASPRLIASLLE